VLVSNFVLALRRRLRRESDFGAVVWPWVARDARVSKDSVLPFTHACYVFDCANAEMVYTVG